MEQRQTFATPAMCVAAMQRIAEHLASGDVPVLCAATASEDHNAQFKHAFFSLFTRPQRPPPIIALTVRLNVATDANTIVGRNADLFVGVQNLDDAGRALEVSLEIGGQSFGDALVPPNGFAFALRGQHVVPFISLQYHKVFIRVRPEGARYALVSALLDTEERRTLARSSVSMRVNDADGARVVCTSGMAKYGCSTMAADVELPDMRELLADVLAGAPAAQRARAAERVAALRQDLMAAAWHPRRMRAWCLAHDDPFAIC